MAQINFSQINQNTGNQNNSSRNDGPQVKFFALKNHGDEAIVRIMHDTVDSFDLVAVHPVEVNGRYRNVNCLRDPREPLDNCPMCASGTPIRQKFYIHLLQYNRDNQGNIVVEPCIWERSATYATTIANLINEYGPLSDHIFKIRRNGQAGSMETTYDIMYGHPNVYKNEIYPKQPELFNGYAVIGRAVLDKNADEMRAYIQTGNFPVNNAQPNNQPAAQPAPVAPVDQAPIQETPRANTSYNPQFAQNNPAANGWGNTPVQPRTFGNPSDGTAPVKAGPRYY